MSFFAHIERNGKVHKCILTYIETKIIDAIGLKIFFIMPCHLSFFKCLNDDDFTA